MNPSASPLFDTLFRPTVTPDGAAAGSGATAPGSGEVASAAPVRVTGTRTRAGNAMNRTRKALLLGAARAVATTGTKIAMAQVATLAGVAKATLYNHFRTRDAVLAALLLDQVQRVIESGTDKDGTEKALPDALRDAARTISRNEVVRGLAKIEPGALASLARIDLEAPAWQLARRGVSDMLESAGRGGADTVLRWLASYLLSPGTDAGIAADVEVLVAGLPVAAARSGAGSGSASGAPPGAATRPA